MAEPGCLNDSHVQNLQVSGFTQLGVTNMKQQVNNTAINNDVAAENVITLTKDMSGTIFTTPRIPNGGVFTTGAAAIGNVRLVLPAVDADSIGEKYTFLVHTDAVGTRSQDIHIQIPAAVGVTNQIIDHATRSAVIVNNPTANLNRVTGTPRPQLVLIRHGQYNLMAQLLEQFYLLHVYHIHLLRETHLQMVFHYGFLKELLIIKIQIQSHLHNNINFKIIVKYI